ncbi:MAG: hypothetical protein R3C58_11210 [Parvularculaceae bacterium]
MRRGAGARFFGAYVNKIDAKGRLAIPAGFRRVIDLAAENVVYCIPHTDDPCIEVGGEAFLERYLGMIDDLEPFAPKRIALERAVATQMRPLTPDPEGRIILPEDLRAHAKLDGQATCAGHIHCFQIWNPALFDEALAAAKKIAGDAKLALRNPAQPNGGAE